MSDFYITLPSHSSKTELPNNASNSFKIRLPHPIRLDGGGWKVGLVAVSLPDPTCQVPPLMKDQNLILFRSSWVAEDTLTLQGKKLFGASFQGRNLRPEDLEILDGKGFMNTMKAFFDKKKVEKVFNAGWKIADANGENHTTAHFEWEGDDLVLHNHDMTLQRINNSYYPAFFINAELGVDMGWFINKGNNNYALGPNLTIEICNGTIPTPADITSINPSTPSDRFWNYGVPSKLIRMTLTCKLEVHQFELVLQERVGFHQTVLVRLLQRGGQWRRGQSGHGLVA